MKKSPDHNAILLTIPAAAKRIGISHHLIRKWVDYGIIPAIQDRRTIKIHCDDVDEWIRKIKEKDFPPEMYNLSERDSMTAYCPPLLSFSTSNQSMRRGKVGTPFHEYFGGKRKL